MKYNQISLVSKITISNNQKIFDKKEIIGEYTILQEKESYLILKNNHQSFAISENQKDINEDEFQIFKVIIKKDTIKLVNIIERCENCTKYKKFYDTINNINFKLWKSLPKCDDDYINQNNEDMYLYHLKENDIICLGNIKFILREVNINNNFVDEKKEKKEKKENNNLENKITYDKRPFTMKLKNNKNKICTYCEKGFLEEDNPIIKECDCEKYSHFKCLKKKVEEISTKSEGDNKNCIRYYLKTNCISCNKFIHLNFFVEGTNGLFELLDIPRNKNEDYLLFETFDFLDRQNAYVKYIFYIKLGNIGKNKNVETILIGREFNSNHRHKKNNNKFDKKILIDDDHNRSISREHAIINCDLEEKSLTLRNISESQNTLVLQNEITMRPKCNDILLQLGNLQIKPHIINNDDKQFEEIKSKMENEPKIEIRQ